MTSTDPASADAAPDDRDGPVHVARRGAVLEITLNRPDVLNALTTAMLEDLAELLEEAAEDPAVRVVLLTGAGRGFSSGADLGAPKPAASAGAGAAPDRGDTADDAGSGRPGNATLRAANRVTTALTTMPQPTVAVVNGAAAGVGVSIALACDLVLAAENAYLLLPFTGIGLMPDGGATALVPAAAGRLRAMELALLGGRLPAPTALAWGLVTRVHPLDELLAEARAVVDRLAVGPALAYAATKRAINTFALPDLDRALLREHDDQGGLLATADFAEAVDAFLGKRPAVFHGH